MPAKQRAKDRGHRLGLRAILAVGDELRTTRMNSGTSQMAVAKLAGTSRASVARYEGGHFEAATFVTAAEMLATVGLGLAVSTYPLGDPPRDRRHGGLIAAFVTHIGQRLAWKTEVPLPNAGDARAWDLVISGQGMRTGCEFERVLSDIQATSRRLALKRRDGGVHYLLVIVADTEANRRALREWPTFMPDLPRLDIEDVFAALTAGRHPGDGIALLKAPRPNGRPSAPSTR